MSYSLRQDFADGFMSAMEKRAGLAAPLGLLNTAANLRTLGDMTNAELGLIMDEDFGEAAGPSKSKSKVGKNKPKARRLSLSIDENLLKSLTPEQRKGLFFAVRRIKAAGATR